jgi:DNA-binding transcriptional LysR family regulator
VIEARHLRVLRAVAATGSFSAAGRELGCTQPAVSQQMKALEASVGTPLLIRTGREMRLTQAGEALVRHAAGIIAGLTAAEEEVAAIAGLRAGRVRLVSFPSGSSTLVPAALAALRAAHPGTRVSLEEAEPPRSVEMLREGDCDVTLAFRYEGAAGAEEWDDLVVRPLLKDRLVGLVPEGHRLARARTVAIGELADEPWIAGCPAAAASWSRSASARASHPVSTSRPTTTRPWSAWSGRASGWRSCRSSPSSPYAPRVRAR